MRASGATAAAVLATYSRALTPAVVVWLHDGAPNSWAITSQRAISIEAAE